MKTDGGLPPVMIVDDDEDDFLLVARRLKQAGVDNTLLPFKNGGDAFMFLKKFCTGSTVPGKIPCLMFLDINMAGLSGFDVLMWARQQPALDSMKIVMLSGANEPHDAQIAAKLGANEFLVKFPEPSVFRELISPANTVRSL